MLLGAGRQARKESLDQYGEERSREEKRREKKKVFHFAAASECTLNEVALRFNTSCFFF